MNFRYMQSKWIRFTLVISCCFMPFSGYAVDFSSDLEKQRVHHLNKLFQAQAELMEAARRGDLSINECSQGIKRITQVCSCLQSELAVDQSLRHKKKEESASIIEKNEISELELGIFVNAFPKITSAAHWAYEHVLVPTQDPAIIHERQTIIKALVKNQDARDQVLKTLHSLSESEEDLLSFWDRYETNSAASLYNRAQRLYFGGLMKGLFGKGINRNKYALEASTLFEMVKSTRNLLLCLGIGHMIEEFVMFPITGKFNLKESLSNGFWGVLGKFWPFRWKTKDTYEQNVKKTADEDNKDKESKEAHENLRRKNYFDVIHQGTFADQVYAISHNIDCTDKFWLPFFGERVRECRFTENPSAARYVLGLSVAGVHAGLRGYLLYEGIKGSYQNWKELFGVIRGLQKRMQKVGAFVQQFTQLHEAIKGVPGLEKLADKINVANNSYSESMKELLKTLQSDTFKESNSIFYQRGKVIAAYKRMDELKKELTPLIQATAELDMYANLAALFDNEDAKGPFCFVEFVDSDEPCMEIKDGWIPFLIKGDIVTNSVSFGNGQPAHKIITGPNGGGKTTNLKMIGYNTVLAQSVGIAAAGSMKMSLLDALKTSFNPREDLQNDMSHFMAQKKRMDDILEHACTRSAQKRMLFLIDEPYGGTVDASTADRTYQFGEYLAPLSNVMSCLATHVKRPITLADAYPGSFENYQIEIQSLGNGNFKRTFRLLPGSAMWWFDDDQKRDEFIDWLSTLLKRPTG